MCFFRKSYPAQFKNEVARLTEELINIGGREDFLSERSGGPFDQTCRHVRAREIGGRMHEIGGIKLMEDTVATVGKKCKGKNPQAAAHLEACWFRIGKF